MPASTTPPPLQGPTAKEKKYDRQLRLWAASGQQALERTHIVLINNGAGVVGIETLKNLVLPGIESFTIFDQDVVKEEDLGVNFFLSEESLGRSRAGECCRYLKELNPEVKGHFESQVSRLLRRGSHRSFYSQNSLRVILFVRFVCSKDGSWSLLRVQYKNRKT